MQVHWARIVVDEGHQLGGSKSGLMSNRLRTCCEIPATSRWIITGTPTPATNRTAGIDHILPLLQCIHADPWGLDSRSRDGPFHRSLREPFLDWDGAALRRVRDVLEPLMIRTPKELVMANMPLKVVDEVVPFTEEHAQSYNVLAALVIRNLLAADWYDEAHRDSLLNPDMSKFARATVSNLRLACCVVGATQLLVTSDDVEEAIEMLEDDLNVHLSDTRKAYMRERSCQALPLRVLRVWLPATTHFTLLRVSAVYELRFEQGGVQQVQEGLRHGSGRRSRAPAAEPEAQVRCSN